MRFVLRFMAVLTVVLVTASTVTAFFGRHRAVVRESYREGGAPLRAALFPRLMGVGCAGSYSNGGTYRERSVFRERGVSRGAGCVGGYSVPVMPQSTGAGCYGSSRSLVYPPAPFTAPAPKTVIPTPLPPKTEVKKPDEPQPQSVVPTYPDALDEVNYKRSLRGLRPFLRDPLLTQASYRASVFRARYRLFGHTSNDFAFLPPGASADAAGCAAYTADYGWMSCCVYDDYQYAGASWEYGEDGKRYMHIFVRGGAGVNVPPVGATVVGTDTGYQTGYDPNCPGGVCPVQTYSQPTRRTGPIRRLLGR